MIERMACEACEIFRWHFGFQEFFAGLSIDSNKVWFPICQDYFGVNRPSPKYFLCGKAGLDKWPRFREWWKFEFIEFWLVFLNFEEKETGQVTPNASSRTCSCRSVGVDLWNMFHRKFWTFICIYFFFSVFSFSEFFESSRAWHLSDTQVQERSLLLSVRISSRQQSFEFIKMLLASTSTNIKIIFFFYLRFFLLIIPFTISNFICETGFI